MKRPARRIICTAVAGFALITASSASARTFYFDAGYQASRDTFSRVAASWTVPKVNCNTGSKAIDPGSYYAVGFGKHFALYDSTVNEIYEWGFCTGIQDTYGIYISKHGGGVGVIDLLQPGDRVTVFVSYLRGQYYFSYVNHTNGDKWANEFACSACDRSHVLVASGLPENIGGPLADYGQVTFSHVSIVDARGRRGTLRNRHWQTTRFVEHDGPSGSFHVAATPGPLSLGGSRFTDYWKNF